MDTTKWLSLASVAALVAACGQGDEPVAWRATPRGDGPRVVWDLYADTLPQIPMPNDVATWPDPTALTGRRLNASQVVPTGIERTTRERFDQLDGWGTFAPISVAFEDDLDLADLLRRQGGTDHLRTADFPGHAVYVIDLTTGLPVALDLNGGNFPYSVTHTDQYQDHDPRSTESNLLFETVEEDANGNGRLDPGEDTDFDGVLDHPNTLDGRLTGSPLDGYDRLTGFYERETKTLILRPILPLRPRTTYAVVITNRLVGARTHAPIRSPFDHVHHVRQTAALEPLPRHFSAHPELYGSLAANGWQDVALAWSFTTQSVTDDLDTIRAGLYGRGVMSRLATEFPADAVPLPMTGGSRCTPGQNQFVASGAAFREALRTIGPVLSLSRDQTEIMVQSYARLSHVVSVVFETPFFLGDPERENLNDAFEVDPRTGAARVNREVISMTMFIPTEMEGNRQPFSPLVFMHGHGSNSGEILGYGGLVLQHGNALVTLNAPGHGFELSATVLGLVRAAFAGQCLQGAATALTLGRARDLDGDMSPDSGADYWTSYLFHTRDSVRQTVIDQMQAIRVLRSFDGRRARPRTLTPRAGSPTVFNGDMDANGAADVAGDFDGNGTPDLGGPNTPVGAAGGSLGGIVTAMLSGSEPAVTSSVPVVGGGGLADIAIRTENGAVLSALILRVMGPLVVSTRSEMPGAGTSCPAGDYGLQVIAPSHNSRVRTEFACLPGADMAGDDLLVVRNATNGEVSCSGSTGGMPGRFRVPVPSDAGDRWVVEYYRHGRDRIHFGDCRFTGTAPTPDRVIRTWEVGAAARTAGCASCARFETTTWDVGQPLVAITAGFGRRRQTPEFRRLVTLAQIALERGDPINYARRVFLDPLTAPDVPVRPRGMLITNTTGDPNVTIATGYALGRAAGIVPFLPFDGPAHLADFRAPADFAARYPGYGSPNDVYLGLHAIEGLPNLRRHPVAGGGEAFLADVDDLSDGRQFFGPDGQTQVPQAMGGLMPVTLGRGGTPGPAMRWSRRSRVMARPGDDQVWTYTPSEPTSGMVSPYVQPKGIHGFRRIYDATLGYDMAVYMFSMLGRYLRTAGTDIPYLSDPMGHHCLEDSTCSYLRP